MSQLHAWEGASVRPDSRERFGGFGSIRWFGQHVGNVAALELSRSRQVQGVMECNWAWRSSVLRSLDFDTALDQDDASMYGLDLRLQAQELGYSVVYEPPGCFIMRHRQIRD